MITQRKKTHLVLRAGKTRLGPIGQEMAFLRPRLYGKTLSRVKGSPCYLTSPGRANFSNISLQNFTNRLHGKQNVGAARKVTRLAGSPTFDGSLLSSGANLSPYKHFGTPSRVNSVKARRVRGVRGQLLTRARGSTFFLHKRLLKLTRLRGRPSCPVQLVSV